MIRREQTWRNPPVAANPPDPALAAMFDEVRARGIEVPNLYRMLGQAPHMLRAWLDFAWPLRLHAQTPRTLRELLILRGAQLAEAEYEWVHHVPMALAAGVPQEQIDELADWRESARFGAAEQAVLKLADEMFEGPASAECVGALVAHFGDSGAVELVLTASFYVCVARFLLSTGVELEDRIARVPSRNVERL
jgi:alkylhydroperoxidase family enzyme